MSNPGSEFWTVKSGEELAREQGVQPASDFDTLVGHAAGLWQDDAEFEAYVAGIYTRRRQDRDSEEPQTGAA